MRRSSEAPARPAECGAAVRSSALLVVVTAAVMVLLGASAHGQSQPNFTGKWTLVPDPKEPGGRGGPVGRGVEFAAVQDGKALTVTTTKLRSDSENPGPAQVYYLDGSASKDEYGFVSTVKWDGGKLVMTKTRADQATTVSTETWSLISADRLIIVLTNYSLANPNNTAIYKKTQ